MTVIALWDVAQGRICPELLRNTTKTLVTSAFLQEEFCAKVLHNNDEGIQNVSYIQSAEFIITLFDEQYKTVDIAAAS
jgi:hypothetical protein